MKKVNYLLLILFTMALMSTSCEKEDSITETDEGIISLTELDGQWNFESYDYKGDEVNFVNLVNYIATYEDIEEDFEGIFSDWNFNSTNMKAIRTSQKYPDNPPLPFNYTKENNTIYIYEYEFTIISYESNVLKLKVIATPFNYQYLGGTLTLNKI